MKEKNMMPDEMDSGSSSRDTVARLLATVHEKALGRPFRAVVSFYERHRAASCILYIVILFCALLYLNMMTTYVADDFGKALVVANFHSPMDWLRDLYAFYMGWGGRIWGELFMLVSVAVPKNIFNVVNSLGCISLIALIYLNALGRWRVSGSLLVLINFALLACLPAYGQNIFWTIGAANYEWLMQPPLLLLTFWRFYAESPREKFNGALPLAMFFMLGVLAGWCQEMVSVGMIFIMGGYMMMYRGKYGGVPGFAKSSMAGVLIGSLLLWGAPGNFARAAAEHVSAHFGTMLVRVIRNPLVLGWMDSGFILCAALGLMFIFGASKRKSLAAIYILGAMASAASFAAAGGIHTRLYFYPVVFLTIAVGMLYVDIPVDESRQRISKIFITVLMVSASCGFFMTARHGIVNYHKEWSNVIRTIEQQKAAGNFDVVVNPPGVENKFVAAYALEIIGKDPSKWPNTDVARYCGLKSIRIINAYTCTEQKK